MEKSNFRQFKGSKVYFGDKAKEYRECINQIKRNVELYGFKELILPTLQDSNIFKKLGETTDIVKKEMYFLEDKKYVLRPEMTLPTAFTVVDKQLYQNEKPLRVYSIANCFRSERPQLGRLREFTQFSIDLINSNSKFEEGELIKLLYEIVKLDNSTKLFINHIGCSSCREEYLSSLKLHITREIEKHKINDDLIESRLQVNPLRILDDKRDFVQKQLLLNAPKIHELLCFSCKEDYKTTKSTLKEFNLDYIEDEKLVRGIDYYTGLVFEFKNHSIGAQSTVCAGGRYDKLYSQISQDKLNFPSVGASIGIERLLLANLQLEEDKRLFKIRIMPSNVVILDRSDERSLKKETIELLSIFRKNTHIATLDTRTISLKKIIVTYLNKPNTILVIIFSLEKVVLKFLDSKEEKIFTYKDLITSLQSKRYRLKSTDELLGDKRYN